MTGSVSLIVGGKSPGAGWVLPRIRKMAMLTYGKPGEHLER
ncbi:hypothetical protein [Nocardia noduli]|nr:hypothetical protein [Nocardia noduli]